MAKVTVIMRSKNSAHTIRMALDKLFEQKYTDFELLCVDSGSTDETLEIIKKHPHRLIEIPAGRYYPGRVLNQAIEASETELIVFQNSDVIPCDDAWLGNLVATVEAEDVCGAYSQQVPAEDADPWVRRDYDRAFGDGAIAGQWGYFYSLSSAAMKRKHWEMRPFYTDAYSSEDTEWGNWMYRHGHKIVYAKDSMCVHSHNSPLDVLYRRKFVEGEADVFIFKKKPAFFKQMARYALDVARDAQYFLERKYYAAILYSPLQRFVYNYAYYRGMLIGYKRIKATVGWKAYVEMED